MKEWLSRGLYLNNEIEILKREYEKALNLACNSTSVMSGDKVQKSKTNSTEDRFIDCVYYSKLIDERIEELYKIKCEILKKIYELNNSLYRQVLLLRYTEYLDFQQISENLQYSYEHTLRLHALAIKSLEGE